MIGDVAESLNLRGVPCPVNSAKILVALAILEKGELLEALVDDGEPIENVPPAIEAAGYRILSKKKLTDHWLLTVEA